MFSPLSSRCKLCLLFLYGTLSLFALMGCIRSPGTISQDEAQQIIDTLSYAGRLFEDLQRQNALDAPQQVVDWLKEQTIIREAGISETGDIYVIYTCGLEGVISGLTYPLSIPVSNYSVEGEGQEKFQDILDNHVFVTSSLSRTAIILLPFLFNENGKSPSLQIAQKVCNSLTQAGYGCHMFEGERVTLEKLHEIENYKITFMITHGAQGLSYWIFTGERPTASKLATWFFSLGIGIGYLEGEGLFFMVNAAFVRQLQLKDALVFLNACYSSNLADAFLDAGASGYFGWTSISYCDPQRFVGRVSSVIFDQLAQPGTTVFQAYNNDVISMAGDNYSVNDLYPVTIYRDTDADGNRRICYEMGLCEGDQDDRVEAHEVDFIYSGDWNLIINHSAVSSHVYANNVVAHNICIPNNAYCDPSKAEGAPDETTPWTGNFVSLGRDGYIIATMEHPFTNGPGADLLIYEVGAIQGGEDEPFDVFISDDGTTWIQVATSIKNDAGCVFASIDISPNNDIFMYVKVVNESPHTASITPGADIDAIEALWAPSL